MKNKHNINYHYPWSCHSLNRYNFYKPLPFRIYWSYDTVLKQSLINSTDSKWSAKPEWQQARQHQLEVFCTFSVSVMGVVTSNLTKSSDLGCQEPQWLHGHSPQALETKSLGYICKFVKTVLSHVARLSLEKWEKSSVVDKSWRYCSIQSCSLFILARNGICGMKNTMLTLVLKSEKLEAGPGDASKASFFPCVRGRL